MIIIPTHTESIQLLKELETLESFVSPLPTDLETQQSFKECLNYLSDTVLNKSFLEENLFDTIICDYNENYKKYSRGLLINEVYSIYNACRDLILNERDYDNVDELYNDHTLFEHNGFIKSEFVIHAHDSRKAPFHWDFRFKNEFATLAYSFVIMRHMMPNDERPRLLVKQQPMHPIAWVDLDHTSIKEGYGAGSVTTIDRGLIYYRKKDDSFSLYLEGSKYKGAFHLIKIRNNLYIFSKANGSIIPSRMERQLEWNRYAKNFIGYLDKRLKRIFGKYYNGISLTFDDSKPLVQDYDNAFGKQINDDIVVQIPTVEECISMRPNYVTATGDNVGNKKSVVNSLEDVMRAVILRYIIWKVFDRVVDHISDKNLNIYDEIYEATKNLDYYKFGYNELKNEALHKKLRLVNMVCAIFMGHRYYGKFDLEAYLISYFSKLANKGV